MYLERSMVDFLHLGIVRILKRIQAVQLGFSQPVARGGRSQYHRPLSVRTGSQATRKQCLVSRASSDGRLNTIQYVDSIMLPRRTHLFGCDRAEPRQGSVSAALTLASDFTSCFSASWVLAECCVDPLRPPRFTSNSTLSVPPLPRSSTYCGGITR